MEIDKGRLGLGAAEEEVEEGGASGAQCFGEGFLLDCVAGDDGWVGVNGEVSGRVLGLVGRSDPLEGFWCYDGEGEEAGCVARCNGQRAWYQLRSVLDMFPAPANNHLCGWPRTLLRLLQ